MRRLSFYSFLFASCLTLVGCAHPVSMAPNIASIKNAAGTAVIDKKVGYHIAETAKALEVTTPAGGGDKVRYFPYRDIEPALYAGLATVFRDVTRISNPVDMAEIRQSGISLLIIPEVTTTSSSPSPVTWPPTQFSVTLTCVVKDASGQTLETVRATGVGLAEFSEFKSNFSLAAVRASENAIQNLIAELGSSASVKSLK